MEKEYVILGKVKDAKILVPDRRNRGGLKGLVIEFETDETITTNSVVYLKYGKKFKPFNVREVSINGDKLVGVAQETGYFAWLLSSKTDLDLRTIIGCEVELVEDEKILSEIREQSCWC